MAGYRQFNFKSSGISESREKKILKRENLLKSPRPIGFKTPLELGNNNSGLFKMFFSLEDQLSDNLKNLILTNKGERLCFGDLGTSLDDIIYSLGEEAADIIAMERISTAINKYMPFINPVTFSSRIDRNNNSGIKVILTLNYVIPNISDNVRTLDITLNLSN